MSKDLHLSEYGSGGDVTLIGADLILTEELIQSAYLAMFGGNVEASTKGNELSNQERFDWWANELFYRQEKNKQFNSITERTLRDVVLNSSGRLEIERVVLQDLEFLKNIAEVSVSVSIETHNRVEISIKIQKLDNQDEKLLQFIFDNVKNEIIISKEI